MRNGFERVHDAEHRSEQTDERTRGTDGGEAADAALQFSVHDRFSAFQSAARGFDIFTRNFTAHLMSFEFLQTGDNDFGQMALVETVGNLDGFIEFAFTQCASDSGSKRTRLLAGGVIGDQRSIITPIDQADMMKRTNMTSFGHDAHVGPEGPKVETNAVVAFLKQPECPDLKL